MGQQEMDEMSDKCRLNRVGEGGERERWLSFL